MKTAHFIHFKLENNIEILRYLENFCIQPKFATTFALVVGNMHFSDVIKYLMISSTI